MPASLPPGTPGPNTLRFVYTPRVADLWRILKDFQDELSYEGNTAAISQIHDLVSTMEMRDRELEDAIVPPYRSRVVNAFGPSITVQSAVPTTVTFDTKDYDNAPAGAGGFLGGTPFSVYTAPINGYYIAEAKARFNPFAANNIGSRFALKNRTGSGFAGNLDLLIDGDNAPAFAGTFGGIQAATIVYMSQGDTIGFQVAQDSGVAETLDTSLRARSWFAVHLLSHQPQT